MPVSATRFSGRAFSVQERTLVREPVQDGASVSPMQLEERGTI